MIHRTPIAIVDAPRLSVERIECLRASRNGHDWRLACVVMRGRDGLHGQWSARTDDNVTLVAVSGWLDLPAVQHIILKP
jgi:hypothetical protein